VIGIGYRAAALLGAGGDARVVAPLSASTCIAAGGELLWLGGPDGVLHARAILLSAPPDHGRAPGDTLRVPAAAPPAWRPDAPPAGADATTALRRGAARLARAAASLGRPEGFGRRLVGGTLAFPLAGARERADALAAACAGDDPVRAARAAVTLLGLGLGLTPSGDDLVGGAFFARAMLTATGAPGTGWRQAAETVRETASRSTHPISAALLGDLLAGEGWAPLHDLGHALASDDEAAATAAARRLVRLGHSSGWDLLAGFVAGAAR
jgi:hypothetical protein